ncbi:Peptidase dimerization domain [Teratosphaeria destructans]|uniref:Peptidase dimerization domain n=1 Tax=Teratosphaeria destructans TaxID=418781 RepID=A0A9W7W3B4_9PEZI|nr:Peptidase dimerization domain [Teratosphaeria destructans]
MKLQPVITCTITASIALAAPQPLPAPWEPVHHHHHHHHHHRPLLLTPDLIAFHKNITEIESITGHEESIGEWLVSSLESQGYRVERQYVQRDPARFNVVAWAGKKSADTKVLLSGHIDTVPPFLPYKHSHTTTNKTISGRGSVDDKGSVAAQIIAVNNLLSAGTVDPDDVALLYVVGEETGGDGMRAANDLNLTPQSIIFGEPTEGKLVTGHKGNLGGTIRVKGRAAHSGYPWLGRSANEMLVQALFALMELGKSLPESDKYGVTTINIGKIEGGVAANVVAEDASASLAIRIAEGTPDFIRGKITQAIHDAVAEFLEGEEKPEDVVAIEWSARGYAPIDIDHDVPGFDTITVNYGTDIPNLKRTVEGQKRYLYGPGTILVAHSDHEMLTEEQLFDAVKGYEKILLHALGGEPCDECKQDL